MTATQLRDLYARKAAAIARRPVFARGIGQARVQLLEGFCCHVEHGDRADRVDLPASEGGTDSAPQPGQLMRASIGACLAIGYRLWAARLGIPVGTVDLEITCEYDARGQMDIDDRVPVGWQSVTIAVTIASSAPEQDLRQLVERANRLSPMLANLSRDVRQVHQLTIVRPAEGR